MLVTLICQNNILIIVASGRIIKLQILFILNLLFMISKICAIFILQTIFHTEYLVCVGNSLLPELNLVAIGSFATSETETRLYWK
jgi:hypothetical protein